MRKVIDNMLIWQVSGLAAIQGADDKLGQFLDQVV